MRAHREGDTPYNKAMPLLMLMRHGKSCWDGPWSSDHERPLAPRGERAAARIGRFLNQAGYQPTVVISSTAVRAKATARLVVESAGWDCRVVSEERLYGGNPEVILDVVRSFDPATACALLVGHNPTWEEMISLLIGGGHFRFPTAAVACLEIDGAWCDGRRGKADLRWFVTPRLLKAAL